MNSKGINRNVWALALSLCLGVIFTYAPGYAQEKRVHEKRVPSTVMSSAMSVAQPNCTSTVNVTGMHYPNQTCAQTQANFQAGMMTSYHLTSKCIAPNKLIAVLNVSCQDAPISGFSNGSVYSATACCGTPSVVIPNLPMQGGNEHTACPVLTTVYTRAMILASLPSTYPHIMLSGLDVQCSMKGPGFKWQSVKFLTCCADPRGPGFGPNATADVTCGP